VSVYGLDTSSEPAVLDMNSGDSNPPDATEAQVQRFLSELEQAPPEVQSAVIARLLAGLAAKLPTNVPAKVIQAAKEGPTGASRKSGSAKGSRTKKLKGEDFARIDSQLALLPDSADPILAWHHFGGNAQALFDVLRFEPIGSLDAMLRHDRMPTGSKTKGRSREALAKNIVERLAAHFG
jgi:hypothetical protein